MIQRWLLSMSSKKVQLFERCVSNGNSLKLPILTFFTKRNEECSLCEIAKEEIMPLKSKFTYEEVYIDDTENKDWFQKYQYHIPVIHINGEFAMKHRVNQAQLEKILDCHIDKLKC